ncbi:MAG: SAM-dependent chlorinase/fluorinase [Pirellulales bacterium]|nr:SAM-dependent chlorinase/fluorinase [Pirellulales bacterium]
MSRHIITLTTDFGPQSAYVAALKGVILSIHNDARLIDLTHAIGPQDVRQGALVLAMACPWFPAGSLHVAVVDPGVGTARELIYAEIEGRAYLAPDNGLLSALTRRARPTMLRYLRNREHWLPEQSHTFHGRDILAPAAAHLSRGLDPAALGPEAERLVELSWPEPIPGDRALSGEVQLVDSFGNLVTNIEHEHLAAIAAEPELRIRCGPVTAVGLQRTYGERPAGHVVALIGSSGCLEMAVVDGNAARRYSLGVGAPVLLTW